MKKKIKPGIVIVDYGMGNLRSVQKAFEKSGVRAVVTDDVRVIKNADKLVLPGVGAFTQAMQELRKKNLIGPIKEHIASGKPYLGICLGLQLLFTSSQEGNKIKGLNVIAGKVQKFTSRKLKIPHMGWNHLITGQKKCPLFKGLKKSDMFYFVHSYFGQPLDKSWVSAKTSYGQDFCSAIWKDNVFATQFHPEKSQAVGLKILKNFIEYQPTDKSK